MLQGMYKVVFFNFFNKGFVTLFFKVYADDTDSINDDMK